MSKFKNFFKQPLWALLLTVFIDLLGVGIIIPVIASLFFRPEGTFYNLFSHHNKNIYYGLFLSSYPLAQFFGAPVLGDLSDKYGRKKILLFSITGTFICYLLTIIGILSGNFLLLIAARIIDGFTGGNITVANSAMADISNKSDKPKNFGLMGAAFGLGFIIGPLMGGVLSDSRILPFFNYSTPFIFSSVLALINIYLVAFNLPETLKQRGKANLNIFAGFKNLARAARLINIRELLIIVFLMTFGFTFFTQFFQIYLIEKFNFTQGDIGILFAYVGLWIVITQGTIVRYISKKMKPRKVLLFSLLMLSLSFPILLVPQSPGLLFLFIPLIAIFQGITQPNLTSIISNLAESDAQGEMLGIMQSIQAMGLAIPPLIASFIVSINIMLPILVAGLLIFSSWGIYTLFYLSRSKSVFTDH